MRVGGEVRLALKTHLVTKGVGAHLTAAPLIMRELVTIVFCLVCAFGIGIVIARGSRKQEKIYGGQWAGILHYIGASAFTGLLPGVLCSIVLGVGSELIIPMFLALMLLTFVSLTLFAVIEYPARTQALRQKQERGWTEKDARSSGL